MQRDMLPTPHPHPQLEPIEPVQSAHPFPIHEPAFAPQQHPDPQIPKPRPSMSKIPNAEPQR